MSSKSLLLLPGLFLPSRVWDGVIPRLQQKSQFQKIYSPSVCEFTSFTDAAESIASTLALETVDNLCIAAHSTSCHIALNLLPLLGSRVSALSLISSDLAPASRLNLESTIAKPLEPRKMAAARALVSFDCVSIRSF